MEEERIERSGEMSEQIGLTMGHLEEQFIVDSIEDIARIDFLHLIDEEVNRFNFRDLVIAYEFYNSYAKRKGFGVRKSKTRKNGDSEVVQQAFVCSREGFRDMKYYKLDNRIRQPKQETRCGCNAKMQVHKEASTGRWIVTLFCDEHNHECMDPRFVGMLRSHKKIREADAGQISHMRSVGISTPLIFGSLASQCGGYEHVGFGTRDMYNKAARDRHRLGGDAKSALLHLEERVKNDPLFYYNYVADEGGVLHHIFWCDGRS